MATSTGDTINGAFKELDFANLVYTLGATAVYNTSTGVLTVTSGNYYESLTLNNPGTTTFQPFNDGSNGTAVSGPGSSTLVIENQPTMVCFTEGTRIRTDAGDVPVEALAVGDFVVTTSGERRAIRWLGRRTVDCARHPHPDLVMPVRIEAHAFGDHRPMRDLLVSPGHAIAVDLLGEVLIPASSLINGATIRQESVERVTYWHVELDSHDVLLAENLPAESYLDVGNRDFFGVEGESLALHSAPDPQVEADQGATRAGFCRPHHTDGAVVAFVRDRLAAHALTIGWKLVEDADLHLVVDGRRVEADVRGFDARFLVPISAEKVWLVSKTAVPWAIGAGPDLRTLGACLAAISISDGFGPERAIAIDDPRLVLGFHAVEPGPQRWTAGRAHLPKTLWGGLADGHFFLRVALARPCLPRWEKDFTASPREIAVA